jgi:hypothetical protein
LSTQAFTGSLLATKQYGSRRNNSNPVSRIDLVEAARKRRSAFEVSTPD